MTPSWVESANQPHCEFSLANLPFCVIRGSDNVPHIGTAIGDQILDLFLLRQSITLPCSESLGRSNLNGLLSESPQQHNVLRGELVRLLEDRPSRLRDDLELVSQVLTPSQSVQFELPFHAGDFTDFYASVFHASNVGAMLRPEQPLMPNYKHLPVGYHGRSSSIVISGTRIQRPAGQVSPQPPNEFPEFLPTSKLDYELELGTVIGQGNALGQPIPISEAGSHIFGYCLLNDWSARDLQKWEYQPLGPFLAKSFATSVSPFVVTQAALQPFRVPAMERFADDPPLLAHLDHADDRAHGGIDIQLEVFLTSQKMREADEDPFKLSVGNFRDMYWTVNQMVAHHTSNGCNLRPGDLLGSGTISGKERTSRGCLLERNWKGEFGDPVSGSDRITLELPTGEKRDFLEDGDEITLTAYCENDEHGRVGFGTCVGRIAPPMSN